MNKTRVMVEFAIYGDNFDSNKITEMLNVPPTDTHIKGDPSKYKYHSYKETLWEYATGYKESSDMNDQIKEICDVFKDKTNTLNKIRNEYAVEIVVCIVIEIENGESPGMRLKPWFIDFSHEIHADIQFDIYFLS